MTDRIARPPRTRLPRTRPYADLAAGADRATSYAATPASPTAWAAVAGRRPACVPYASGHLAVLDGVLPMLRRCMLRPRACRLVRVERAHGLPQGCRQTRSTATIGVIIATHLRRLRPGATATSITTPSSSVTVISTAISTAVQDDRASRLGQVFDRPCRTAGRVAVAHPAGWGRRFRRLPLGVAEGHWLTPTPHLTVSRPPERGLRRRRAPLVAGVGRSARGWTGLRSRESTIGDTNSVARRAGVRRPPLGGKGTFAVGAGSPNFPRAAAIANGGTGDLDSRPLTA